MHAQEITEDSESQEELSSLQRKIKNVIVDKLSCLRSKFMIMIVGIIIEVLFEIQDQTATSKNMLEVSREEVVLAAK